MRRDDDDYGTHKYMYKNYFLDFLCFFACLHSLHIVESILYCGGVSVVSILLEQWTHICIVSRVVQSFNRIVAL